MAVKFTYHGESYTADTPEEAVRLRHLLEDADYERAKKDPGFRARLHQRVSGWSDEKFWKVINALGPLQTRFLVAIYLWTSIDSRELATVLELPSQEALAGVVSGLSKQLEKLDVTPSEVFYVETYWVGKKKERYFHLSDGFDGAATELHWGHYWRLEQWAKQMEARLKQSKAQKGDKSAPATKPKRK